MHRTYFHHVLLVAYCDPSQCNNNRTRGLFLVALFQAEEDRKAVLAKRFNYQLQQGMHDSLDIWKEAEDLK